MPERAHKIFRILTLNQISTLGLKLFDASHYVVGNDMTEPDAILVRSHNMLQMDIPPSVKAIGRAGAGTNNVPVKEMNLRGVAVFNAPGANANAVKELVLAGLLMASRNLVPAIHFAEGLQGDNTTLHNRAEEGKKQFAGIELPGRTLGIIGLGAVGRLVAVAAIRLGMKVMGYDPNITVDAAWNLPSEVKRAESLEDLVRNSEFITLHVPLLDATHHLINHRLVQTMKNGTILLNFSRDGIVDENAVLEGIELGKIRYYVCDFPSQLFQHHPKVITLPHLGASTLEAEENCAVMVVNQMIDYLENGNITNAVNFPNITMERESPYRLAVANANVPNMVGQISTSMANAGLNIHNMGNKSRGEMAYTLVDVDSPVPQTTIDEMAAIRGVLMARYLPVLAE
ncbi:3-phosphoglycerate dehydrogenase family protein [Nitrosospira sp. Is2]|uniref:3-phosphoglycerate dehydrogenase family protein n=1 Tax=Nitrosospira sp. Is2 TaxID=3080532 RepID=UPI0029554E05|nr:3-phosphoglycerate dehydrogenase family protein [Nitrosospira sp. Is2]WON74656.1 3-phosphoglycerate dehydrogenase family protein [Nitrosospira sp. Is2]